MFHLARALSLWLALVHLPTSAFAMDEKGNLPPTEGDLFGFARDWMDPEHQAPELILLLMGLYSPPTPTPSFSETPTETEPIAPDPTETETPSETVTATDSPTVTASLTPSPSQSPTSTNTQVGVPAFVNYENAPIHPVDLSPSGQFLAVVNLPDYRLMLFDVTSGTPVWVGDVPVGVDPVAARFRTDTEVWVVNHVSDSISIVELPALRVRATLETHDEPCDVVFAGNPERAFVSCSQVNELQVFDPSDLTMPPVVIPIDAEDPRALAASPDGSMVYAAIFESGNGSTLLGGGARDLSVIDFPPNVVSDPSGPYGGVNPPPNHESGFNPPLNPSNPTAPRVPLIVKKDDQGFWRDDNGTDWSPFVSGASAHLSGRVPGWDLPDRDVAIVDTSTLQVTGYSTRLMNICMSLAVNPASGKVAVVGTDGINEVRFEPVIGGRFHRVNVALTDASGGSRQVVDLNPHLIPYDATTTTLVERNMSLGDPRGIAWNSAGTRAYVTGMGSNNIVVIDSDGARAGLAPTIEVGEGPTGLALDEARERLYVLNRFEGSISVVSVTTETELARVPFYDPTPPEIKIGRKHLYNTHKNSGLGHIACASCHVDGRMDRLAWDLGDPSGEMKDVNSLRHNLGGNFLLLSSGFEDFHPMKGPMTTQTLQDIIGHEPLHWRGDRDGLEEFNGAFKTLQAADKLLTQTEMQEFEDFLDTLTVPPNPNRNFDNTLPADLPLPGHFTTGRFGQAGLPLPNGSATRGLMIYRDAQRRIDQGAFSCVTCHTLPTGMGTDFTLPNGLTPPFVPRLIGPNGERHHALVSVDGSTNRAMKIPHLRNQFEKTGCNFTQTSNRAGFGYQHDGAIDSLERFLSEGAFDVVNDQEVADLVSLVLSFSGSELPPGDPNDLFNPPGPLSQDSHASVGKQETVSAPVEPARLVQMRNLANAGKVDLIVKGVVGGAARGAYYERAVGRFLTDLNGESLSPEDLLALAAPGVELTYTVVPFGVGRRAGIDRDLDGFGDRTEVLAGSDPTNPSDTP